MAHIVQNKHMFNNSVLTVDFFLIEPYSDCISISKVDFEEFNSNTGTYEAIDETLLEEIPNELDPKDNSRWVITLNDSTINHLVKATVWLDPSELKGHADNPPCCVHVEEIDGVRYWVYESFFVDMSVYERNLLNSINLGCEDNCDVPIDTINKLLRLFAVHAAVDSNSPQLEMIFSKIGCGKASTIISKSFSRNCNCNG